MTTQVAAGTTVTVPAHIAARIQARGGKKSEIMAAVASGGVLGPTISIKGGRYRLKEDAVETVVGITLDVVIVGANPKVSKIYFAGTYNGAENTPPTCISDDGITPNPDVATPVSPNCASCPNNILGSKNNPSGAKSKLCADQRHLAVVPAADPTKVYGLSVPVSAMKGMREYFKDLDNFGLVVEEVITTLGFDDQAEYPKITFRQKENGFVPESVLPMLEDIMKSDATKLATRTLPRAAAPALAAPAAAPALTPPPAYTPPQNVAPAPVVQAAPAAPAPVAPAPVVQAAPVAPAVQPAVAPVAENTTPAAPLTALEAKLANLFR